VSLRVLPREPHHVPERLDRASEREHLGERLARAVELELGALEGEAQARGVERGRHGRRREGGAVRGRRDEVGRGRERVLRV